MSEYTEDFFLRCWIIFKTRYPRQAKKMDIIEAEIIGAIATEKPKKENKKNAQPGITVV